MTRIYHKFKATRVEHDGIRFDSKLEGRYYKCLKKLRERGDVVMFLRQVPFHLPGSTRLVVDFLEFWKDGTCRVVDVKGLETDSFKIKKRQVEELYPVELVLMKAKDVRHIETNLAL